MGSMVQCGTWRRSQRDRNNFRLAIRDTGLQLDFPHFNVLLKPKLVVSVYLDLLCKLRTKI